MKTKTIKITGILLTVVMLVAMFGMFSLTASAASNVSYIDANGTAQVCASATEITNQTTLNAGWYVVNKSVTISGRITVKGDVHLILADGYTLTANAGIGVNSGNSLTIYGQAKGTGKLTAKAGTYNAGIGGTNGASGQIIINGGNITATGGEYSAGIGGGYSGVGNVTINGGTVTATGGTYGTGIGNGRGGTGGTVTINGGNITATGGTHAPGIGNGTQGSGVTVTISGGNITARGAAYYGAGIGGGSHGAGGTITISGGTVTATGGDSGAGIGGGAYGGGGTITISGGTVTATGGDTAAGIGGGFNAGGGTVTISGGTVKATGGENGAAIGSGEFGSGGTLKNGSGANLSLVQVSTSGLPTGVGAGALRVNVNGTPYPYGTKDMKSIDGKLYLYLPTGATTEFVYYTVTLAAGEGSGTNVTNYTDGAYTLPAYPSAFTAPDGYGLKAWRVNGEEKAAGETVNITADTTITAVYGKQVNYIDKDGNVQTVLDPTPITNQTALSNGWYIVNSNVTIGSRITVSGDVHLILADGYTLTVNAGIGVNSGNSLTIYGQTNGTGKLTATAPAKYNAGIGGTDGDSGQITINGGNITANGGEYSTGIGGGFNGVGNVTINGGNINATGSSAPAAGGAGIGGGKYKGGNVTINGGNVTATGGTVSAGIGGAENGVGNVTITGGTITATGNLGAAGIGGGLSGNGNVTISGGTITATGGAAGIGSGSNGSSTFNPAIIKINGGSVNASSISNPTDMPQNDGGEKLTLITFTDVNAEELKIGYADGTAYHYGTKDMQPIEGTLYLYLPDEVDAGKYQVTLAAGAGSGDAVFYYTNGGDYTLPECAFTAPDGYQFKAWLVNDTEKAVGDTIAITADTTVTAVYGKPIDYLDNDGNVQTAIATPITSETTTLNGG